jgi:hypothetical protein
MTPTAFLIVACFAAAASWSCYEAFRMRQHRRSTEYILHLVTITLEKMQKRQDAALLNDATIARSLETIHERLSRPADPADGGQP